MIGKTPTIRRIATGLALATTTAVLVAPAASGKPNYGPPDTWALPYLAASPSLFVTDTLNSARVERTQASVLAAGKPDYGPPDPWALPYLAASPSPFVTDTLNSARVERTQASVLAAGKPNYGPPDPWALPYLTESQGAGPFVTDTLNSARVERRQAPTLVSGGFNWGSFGIGIATAAGALLVLAGLRVSVRQARQARPPLGGV